MQTLPPCGIMTGPVSNNQGKHCIYDYTASTFPGIHHFQQLFNKNISRIWHMTNDPLDKRVNNLEQEIDQLKNQLRKLTIRLDSVESLPTHHASPEKLPTLQSQKELQSTIPDIDSDKLWSWVGKSSLLPRIATVCFIMVFALILRTLADNNTIGVQLGFYFGIGYASLLIGWGTWLLSRKNRVASVFPVCGVLLIYSIALESHFRFASVSSLSVYTILFVLLVTTSLVGIYFQHIKFNTLSILGTCIVASIIDFPKPYFTPLIFLLLTGNILAYFSAKKLDKGEWNRLAVFLLTVMVWLLWTFRLRVPITKGMTSALYLSQNWFFPAIIIFSLIFIAMSAHVALKRKSTLLDLILPTLNILWAFPMALVIIKASESSPVLFGYSSIFIAAIHVAIAAYLYRKKLNENSAICGFTLAGLLLFMAATPLAFGNNLPALLLWSIIAFILAKISKTTAIGGLRLISYLIQVLTCLSGLMFGEFLTTSPQPIMAMIVAGIIAGLSGSQFLWCRKEKLMTENGFFGNFDKSDRSALALLFTSLISGYLMLHLLASLILGTFSSDPINTIKGVQSILINFGAISLLLLAMPKRNKELLTTAVLIIIIGAFKVFAYDLFKSNGIPLVLSVLSFGGVAAIGSVIMNRWSKTDQAA